ncbi:MAG: hypothetical protein QOC59_1579 [Microbacteriaceae bacterium]|jgi:hypothetical protein|nr:hypothetical protein [Microbacteriaceae bacterium]
MPPLFAAPTPSPSPSFNPDVVTPGVAGFITVFLIAVVTVLLILDMTRRIRRARYRGELAEREAEDDRG